MDRLSWYQSGESMEEILCQAGSVGIYDGDLKQVRPRAIKGGRGSLVRPLLHCIPITNQINPYPVQSSFEQGTASLTYQRIIWADSTDPVSMPSMVQWIFGFLNRDIQVQFLPPPPQDCRLVLHHSLVQKIEKHHKSMFGRGGKIVATVKPVPAGQVQGPIAASGAHSLRFVFRNGGEEDVSSGFSSGA